MVSKYLICNNAKAVLFSKVIYLWTKGSLICHKIDKAEPYIRSQISRYAINP